MHPRPDPPGPGQESVWDYPRPPRVERTGAEIEIRFGGAPIARTHEALRVLETSHPPTYYLPEQAFATGVLVPTDGSSWCEWKGRAAYFDVVAGGAVARRAGWTYPEPSPGFEPLQGYVAVMPAAMDGCFVDGERAEPQAGGFYGGWITRRISGPFKGGPGTHGW